VLSSKDIQEREQLYTIPLKNDGHNLFLGEALGVHLGFPREQMANDR
jgi:hypothetical protein